MFKIEMFTYTNTDTKAKRQTAEREIHAYIKKFIIIGHVNMKHYECCTNVQPKRGNIFKYKYC